MLFYSDEVSRKNPVIKIIGRVLVSSRRFFLSNQPIDGQAQLTGSEAHHLANVLRAKPGDTLELIDGKGAVWQGLISSIEAGTIRLTRLEMMKQHESSATRLILAQSLCKADKLEWILQKAAELGADEIFLLAAERCVVKITQDKLAHKMERWEKIILAAAKQCRRSSLPCLHPPLTCRDFLQQDLAEVKLLLSEHGGMSLKSLLRKPHISSVIFTIGPEGGWTRQEEEAFQKAGFEPTGLGANILRTETAAIAALAIIQYELNSLHSQA